MKSFLKKGLGLLLVCLFLSCSLPVGVLAEEKSQFDGSNEIANVESNEITTFYESQTEGDYSYTNVDGGVCINHYNGNGGDIIIPSSLGGKVVIGISDWAFSNSNITSVTIPKGITNLNWNLTGNITCEPFSYCRNLMSITVEEDNLNYSSSNGVLCNKDGSMLIKCPEGRTTVSLADSIKKLDSYAFNYCNNLESILVDAANMNYFSIHGVLYNKDASILVKCPEGVKDLSIPDGLTSIAYGAFKNCKNLTSINIPDSVVSIEMYAFQYCTSLKEMRLPSSLTKIESSTFTACKELRSVYIPEGVTSIDYGAFQLCENLSSIVIPKSVRGISGGVFFGCGNLASIQFNSDATTISDSGSIPSNVMIIGYDPSTAKDYAAKYNRTFKKIGELTEPIQPEFVAFLGKDPQQNYYEYNAIDLNNSYLAYQINPGLASAKMYQQFLDSQCKVIGLKDKVKGYMDYFAAASASLKAQIKGEAFNLNTYFAGSGAKLLEEVVENVKTVDKDGNLSLK